MRDFETSAFNNHAADIAANFGVIGWAMLALFAIAFAFVEHSSKLFTPVFIGLCLSGFVAIAPLAVSLTLDAIHPTETILRYDLHRYGYEDVVFVDIDEDVTVFRNANEETMLEIGGPWRDTCVIVAREYEDTLTDRSHIVREVFCNEQE